MHEVVSHLENENETTEFSLNAIARLKQIVNQRLNMFLNIVTSGKDSWFLKEKEYYINMNMPCNHHSGMINDLLPVQKKKVDNA